MIAREPKRKEESGSGVGGSCPQLGSQIPELLVTGLPRAPGPFPVVRESEGPQKREPGGPETPKLRVPWRPLLGTFHPDT